jgi:hypothetical protein
MEGLMLLLSDGEVEGLTDPLGLVLLLSDGETLSDVLRLTEGEVLLD